MRFISTVTLVILSLLVFSVPVRALELVGDWIVQEIVDVQSGTTTGVAINHTSGHSSDGTTPPGTLAIGWSRTSGYMVMVSPIYTFRMIWVRFGGDDRVYSWPIDALNRFYNADRFVAALFNTTTVAVSALTASGELVGWTWNTSDIDNVISWFMQNLGSPHPLR